MKYFNKKVEYQGLKFDSRVERDRYIKLKDFERKGFIDGLELQKGFELLPKQMRTEVVQLKTKTKTVERVDERAVHYHADFFYHDISADVYVVEEIKSKATALVRDYPLRRKLVKLMIRRLNEEAGCEKYIFNEVVN